MVLSLKESCLDLAFFLFLALNILCPAIESLASRALVSQSGKLR